MATYRQNASDDDPIKQYALLHPGQRPESWWRVSARERRRQLNDSGRPAHLVSHSGVTREIVRAGILLLWCDDHEDSPRFESEATYLLRLGLLYDGELERIPSRAFDDEVLDEDLELDDALGA